MRFLLACGVCALGFRVLVIGGDPEWSTVFLALFVGYALKEVVG